LALLCLGEIGRRTDLSSATSVESAVNASLNSENEDIRAAASLALGGVACGNLGRFLPALLQSIEGAGGQSKQQYLLLQVGQCLKLPFMRLQRLLFCSCLTNMTQGRCSAASVFRRFWCFAIQPARLSTKLLCKM
jgi:hypothetical protein